uniref:MIP18 family-like domain-containing protein n=1 Tax=Manihot esculenta TaxID=3983 RepID=A0A2C9W705_MANES
MVSGLINPNPIVYEKKECRVRSIPRLDLGPARFLVQVTKLTPNLNFSCFTCDQKNLITIKDIKDPEHPYSLEELKVITEDAIEVDDKNSYVRVTFTPTVEHCSMATVIGLCLRVKLMRSLPSRYKVDIRVAPGTHATEAAVNKQLNDKERVAAALENPNLVAMVDECLAQSFA